MAEVISGAPPLDVESQSDAADVTTSHPLSERLRFAIANRHLIEVCYHGSVRVAEPHDYGIHKGIERLLIFQLRESSHSHRSATGWRLLDTSHIEECLVLERSFAGNRGQLHQSHLVWDVIYARVD